MNINSKKMISNVLIAIMFAAQALTGCGNQSTGGGGTDVVSNEQAMEATLSEELNSEADAANKQNSEADASNEQSSQNAETDASNEQTTETASSKEQNAETDTSENQNTQDALLADQSEDASGEDADVKEKNGEIYILCTSDVHCGVDQGFGYAGLYEVRKNLEDSGYTTILVDDGDNIQGEALGTLTDGQMPLDLMNDVGYDVAIPGNHEFDYGMDRFLELAEQAKFKYVSCNFNKEGELIFDPYTIVEACGKKIAFIGVTTPETMTSSTPSNFQNEEGEFIYGFMQDENGEAVYNAIQNAADAARAEGADYVYVLGHMGLEKTAEPWTYADIISHTTGIDVMFDGHSHDTEQVVMNNADGVKVARCAVGTKMSCIGYSHITDDGISETNIWSWPNSIDAPTLLGINNPIDEEVDEKLTEIDEILSQKVAHSDVKLTIDDPVEKDTSGNPIRMVRRAETNMGDLCADAMRFYTDADIGIINGGGIRASLEKGDITNRDILAAFPWNNSVCLIEATGQQILDALEWGARGVPEENGAFLQVSGLTYEIDTTVSDPCSVDADSMLTGIKGERRVRNVLVGDEPIDPGKTYTVAGIAYSTIQHGDGQTAFDKATVISSEICIDNVAISEYIQQKLGGSIGEDYENPYGQGRINILE